MRDINWSRLATSLVVALFLTLFGGIFLLVIVGIYLAMLEEVGGWVMVPTIAVPILAYSIYHSHLGR